MQIKVHTSPELQAWGITVLRVIVGLVFVAHGLQKLYMGLDSVADSMAQYGFPMPMAAAYLATAIELLGGLALLGGFLTRWAAIPLALEMLVAGAVVHWPAGFFLPNGYEFALTLLGACAAISLLGPGVYALDNVLPVERWEIHGPRRPVTKAA